MHLLIVEDRARSRERLKSMIGEINSEIRVDTASSYEDLIGKLFANVYDTAVVDIDLTKWDDFGDAATAFIQAPASINNGEQIADLIERLHINSGTRETVALYTGNTEVKKRSLARKRLFFDKGFKLDFMADFGAAVIDELIDITSLRHIPDPKEFHGYSMPQKIKYIKEVLSMANTKERFSDIGPFAWVAKGEESECKALLGEDLSGKSRVPQPFQKGDYGDLQNNFENKQAIPAALWNFNDSSWFAGQAESFNRNRLKNELLDTYFDLAFAAEFAGHLLEIATDTVAHFNGLKLLKTLGKFCGLETQNYTIRKMHENGDSPSKITTMIDEMANATGTKIVDHYFATIMEFDVEEDKAKVLLKSMIDPSKCFTKDFGYKRLKAQGLKFKESNFYYYVVQSENEGSVMGTVEPQ